VTRTLTVAFAAATVAVGTSTPRVMTDAIAEVFVAATSPGGTAIHDLTAADVEVTSDGATLPVASLTPQSHAVSVVFLLDMSASARPVTFGDAAGRDLVKEIERTLAPALRADDTILVGTVARSIHIGPRVDVSAGAIKRAFERAFDQPDDSRAGPSPLWDGLAASVDALPAGPGPRAVVVYTDGRVTGSRLGMAEAGEHAMLAGVMVFVLHSGGEQLVAQGTTVDGKMFGARVRSDVHVRAVADATGGLYVPFRPPGAFFGGPMAIGKPEPLGAGFAKLVTGLRDMYSLKFTAPAADGRLHRIEVRTTRPDVTLRGPRGYVAPKGQEVRQ
jgi:hypothetical protein